MTILGYYPAARTWFATPEAVVSGAANNGSGFVRLTVDTTATLDAVSPVLVSGVLGTTEANGPSTATVVDPTHLDLSVAYSNAYKGGGKVFLQAQDGFPIWPAMVRETGYTTKWTNTPRKLRLGGFGAWSVTTAGGTVWAPAKCGPIGPLVADSVGGGDPLFPMRISIDGGASDGGVDSYAWWLSARIEATRQPSIYFPTTVQTVNAPRIVMIAHPDRTHSGTILLSANPAEVVKLFPRSGGVPPTDADSLLTLLNRTHLYVTRRSDQAMAWARLVDGDC